MIPINKYNNIKSMLLGSNEDVELAFNILENMENMEDYDNVIPYSLLFNITTERQWKILAPKAYKKHIYPNIGEEEFNISPNTMFLNIIKTEAPKEYFEIFVNNLKKDIITTMHTVNYKLIKDIQIKIDYYE